MKKRLYNLLHHNKWFIKFIYALIILNVIALFIESYPITDDTKEILDLIEIVSIVLFTIEYLVRIWVADVEANNFSESVSKRIKFIFSFFGLIDLLAILPFFLPFLFVIDLRSIRILRLLRLLRILKIGRYSKSMKLISDVLKETKAELLVTLFICTILMIFSSTLMFYIENEAQPDLFKNAGQSLWWSIATLTTIGYGDIYPITAMGKVLSAFIALVGIGFIALPTGIISSAFISKLDHKQKDEVHCTCPNCDYSFTVKIKD